ncbi:MAG: glycosyltransferase family 4 protein [Candidatus Heimdallarchaeota archaeon]
MRVNFILDMEKSLRGSGVYSSAVRFAKELERLGVDVVINGKSTSYDVFHFHTSLPQSLLKAQLIRRRRGTSTKYPQIVMTGHTTIEDFHDSFLFSNKVDFALIPYLTKFYSLADHLVAVSMYNRSVLTRYGFNSDQIHVISNGIDLNRISKNKNLRTLARKHLQINENQFLIVNVGICIYRKAPDMFVDVALNTPEHRFLWVGKYWPLGIIAHSPYLREKFRLAREAPNIQFAGYVSRRTLEALWNAADIFLYMSREENQGIALLEAIAYGKIPIVRKHPVFDWLTHKRDCLKGEIVQEFTDLIRDLGDHPDEFRKIRKNGQHIVQNHDIQNSIRELADLYAEIC